MTVILGKDTTTNSQSIGGGGSKDIGITKGGVAGISIVATLVCVLLTISVLTKCRKNREKRYQSFRGESEKLTPNEQTKYGAHFSNSQPETEIMVES
ncbi:hypothetical protein KUTeg_020558 [Tegillarca granosa]|uniref:Uncharacterized protein n=1 Tax=Tegillarca granosa TaxID=220873 RepID=A0ABQ9ECL6_TEGGR|nr:hypothetical protein KUTeg_020558 [Tegillarca granosa]